MAILQTAKTDPTEMSICPVRIIRVMPMDTIITGIMERNRSVKFSAVKKP
jgi:hypothetical protein